MSRSASQLNSLTTRDTLYSRSCTLEFGAGPLAGWTPACPVHTIVTTGPSHSERL